MERALISGATGLVGCGLTRQLLTEGTDVTALVRGTSNEEARNRLLAALNDQFSLDGYSVPEDISDRLHVISTDICSRESVMSVADKLNDPIDTFWHSAACVNFVDAIQCEEVNVGGSLNIIELASAIKPKRYNHFSTAFIAGGYRDMIMENEMPPRETLNAYEDTKYQSELNLRAQDKVPFTVLRPSIIVGNRANGRIRTFKNFYLVIKYFAKMANRNKIIPRFSNLDSMRINLVPLDFVVETSLEIGKLPSTGKTYNIVNDSPPNIGLVVEAIEAVTGVKVMASGDDENAADEAALIEARFKEFMPYFFGSPGYEMTSMEEICGSLEKSTLPLENLMKIIAFFIEKN